MDVTVVSATHYIENMVIFVLDNGDDVFEFVYSESDPYSGALGQYLKAWIAENEHLILPYTPPEPQPPMPYNFQIVSLWQRLTDDEAEEFDGVATTASPLRLRKQFAVATSMMSDGELFAWVRDILVGLFGETRADALLAETFMSRGDEITA